MPGCDVRTLDALRFELKPCCDENPESMLDNLRGPNHALFGLPCARCRAYYDADLDACPICGCKERCPRRREVQRSVRLGIPSCLTQWTER